MQDELEKRIAEELGFCTKESVCRTCISENGLKIWAALVAERERVGSLEKAVEATIKGSTREFCDFCGAEEGETHEEVCLLSPLISVLADSRQREGSRT